MMVLVVSVGARAQSPVGHSYVAVSAGPGFNQVGKGQARKFMGPAAQFAVGRQLLPRLSLQGELGYTKFDPDRPDETPPCPIEGCPPSNYQTDNIFTLGSSVVVGPGPTESGGMFTAGLGARVLHDKGDAAATTEVRPFVQAGLGVIVPTPMMAFLVDARCQLAASHAQPQWIFPVTLGVRF